MDDLPELPFEKVLSYLSLEDRLKARAVSRRWYHKINCFKVNTLCYSNRKRDFIYGKNRWVNGVFAQNFINSNRFAPFFDSFVQNSQGQTILSNLKHLRLCDLDLNERGRAAFTRTLNSFVKLEELDIIRTELKQQDVLNLNLPMLTSLHLEEVKGIEKLTLKALKLQQVKILECSSDLRLKIVHGESVERLFVDWLKQVEVKNLKNLQYLYVDYVPSADPTFLSSLQQLKEIHSNDPRSVWELFDQKQRSGRADLKVYLCSMLLNGPHDPAMDDLRVSYESLGKVSLFCLAKNPSRLAGEIPFYRELVCWEIGDVAPGSEVDLLKRCTPLNQVTVYFQVQDIQRFLNLLKNCDNIVYLTFRPFVVLLGSAAGSVRPTA